MSNSSSKISADNQSNLTLEQKLTRLQEIQTILEKNLVNLTESVALFEEANKLKHEIEIELKTLKSKVIEIEAVSNANAGMEL